jgi:adenylate cyclase class 2
VRQICTCSVATSGFVYTRLMAAPQEIEIKFVVPDLRALEQKLGQLGFHLETPFTHEVNTLYDLPSQKLRRKGELLRLRQYGEKWKLTHKAKGKTGRHKSRAELESSVSDGKQMDNILRALGYRPSFIYEKFRAEWSDDEGAVVLDHTPIGNIAEIEGKSRWIDRIARALGVNARDYITKSYTELFFDWKRNTGSSAKNMTFRECGGSPRKLEPKKVRTSRPTKRSNASVATARVRDSARRNTR